MALVAFFDAFLDPFIHLFLESIQCFVIWLNPFALSFLSSC